MAQKKSSNTKATPKNQSSSGKKGSAKNTKNVVQEPEKTQIPIRLITSAVFAALFIVGVIMLITPDGVVVKLLYSFALGMFGKIGFYTSLPALLYLFFIHAFSYRRPVVLRSISVAGLIVCIGCIAHLFQAPDVTGTGFAYISQLYQGGIAGTTGGLVCGLIAEFLDLLFAVWLSYIILIVAAAFALLGSMQITIPSLIRAFENRPRGDWEMDEDEVLPEPASVLVDSIAKKRIKKIENRRKANSEKKTRPEPIAEPAPKPSKRTNPKPAVEEHKAEQTPELKQKPSANPDTKHPEPLFIVPESKPVEDSPSKMPPLEMDAPVNKPLDTAKKKVTAKDAEESAAMVAAEIAENEEAPRIAYQFPPIDLLKPSRTTAGDATAEMRENADRLDDALASFGIEAHITNVTRGPSVTRYEVELQKGVRFNRVTNVANDLALSLGVASVRISTVVGKISVIGIEVPNKNVTSISLREVIDSQNFVTAESKSTFAVGKDIGGNCVVSDISKLPHMLIAGTTGSGKSVCMNSIIISLLYKASPEEVKLIMIDPKMVELGIYNGIPHLMIPVVTDPKKAAGSLQWAVTEMMRRYKAMSGVGVRDLESYNAIMESEEGQKMPQVVVIIDELADLMLAAAKEVEESICRIAQMGRAAGIHLVIATQRPSADVITGLMKANIPSRIAFSVASAMESRIILDTQGAEKLVGKGDMLFSPIGSGKPLRVQGCYVSDPEVEAVANFVKENSQANYDQKIMDEIERKASQGSNGKSGSADYEPSAEEADGDEMLPAAVDVILETGQASVSMLQRRLKLGYSRAARIVDEMEEKGIVGPFQGSKPRTILITKEQWEAMKSGQPQQLSIDEMDDDFDPEDFQ